MVDRAIAIDYDKCVGCRICEIVCSLRNTGEINPAKSRIRVVRFEPEGNALSFPFMCMKCVEAPCKSICPTGAISDDPITGARLIDTDKCIGCSACVYACPFGAISIDRVPGVAFTCNLCGGDPTCVQFCPRDAIQYLDRNEVSIRLARSRLENYVTFANTGTES